MRAKAHGDLGAAADCVLATFGYEPAADDSDTEIARAYTGAILILQALAEIKAIRMMLTPKDKTDG